MQSTFLTLDCVLMKIHMFCELKFLVYIIRVH